MLNISSLIQNDPQGSQEVGLAISLLSCPEPNPCASPQSELGYVLYKGPYDPEQQGVPEPFQNFTVTVPSGDDFKGRAQLSVVRFHLNSVRFQTFLEKSSPYSSPFSLLLAGTGPPARVPQPHFNCPLMVLPTLVVLSEALKCITYRLSLGLDNLDTLPRDGSVGPERTGTLLILNNEL